MDQVSKDSQSMAITQLFVVTCIAATSLLVVGALALLKLKSKLLWQRWATWLAISVCFGGAYLLGQTEFNILVCLIALVMMFELLRLLKVETFGLTLVLLLTWVDLFQIIQGRSAAEFFWVIPVMMFFVNLLDAPKELKLRSAIGGMYGSLLISLGFVQLIQFPDKSLALLLAVACFDVCSFLGGKSLGKVSILNFHFSPKTSPNKTVGGLVVGAFGLALALVAIGKLSLVGFCVILVGAVLGDYLESWIKRLAGVKDAGDWLPGFGGLLDRFDSVILLAPLVVFIF